MSELPATIRILDRPYKMRVKSEDEQFLLKAAELINTQTKNYSRMYAYNDRQDLLAMVALTQITQLLKLQDKQQFRETGLEKRLAGISQLLDSVEKSDDAAEALSW